MFKKEEKKISSVLDGILGERSKFSEGYRKNSMATIWEKILGKTVIKYTQGLRLENEKLYVKISSAPLRNELEFEKEKLIDKINKELEHREIKELIIT